jgi:hypothetical protein
LAGISPIRLTPFTVGAYHGLFGHSPSSSNLENDESATQPKRLYII